MIGEALCFSNIKENFRLHVDDWKKNWTLQGMNILCMRKPAKQLVTFSKRRDTVIGLISLSIKDFLYISRILPVQVAYTYRRCGQSDSRVSGQSCVRALPAISTTGGVPHFHQDRLSAPHTSRRQVHSSQRTGAWTICLTLSTVT